MTRSRASAAPPDPDEGASWWSARRRLGLLTPREEEVFAQWLALPAHEAAWTAVEERMESVNRFAAMPEILAMRQVALAARPRPMARFWHPAGLGAAVAAALVLAILTCLSIFNPPASVRQGAAAPVTRYATQIGEQKTIRLPDGSTVQLNTASVLEVAYSPRRRDLRLLSGQALFDVAHAPERPFAVSAGDRVITATGTMFDVRVEPGGTVTVVLTRGHVVVDPLRRSGLARLVPRLERDALEPGQRLSSTPDGQTHIATTDIARETSWTQGQLVFRGDRLADVVHELNRYSTSRLVVEDPGIADLKVNGVFRMGQSANFVAALTALYPIEAVPDGPQAIRLEPRETSIESDGKKESSVTE